MRYTNIARTQNGRSPLATSSRLMEAARLHAEQMATYQRLDHTIPGARYPTMQSRLQAVGYEYANAAENVAWNQSNAQSAVTTWMNSSGHRANILDPNLTEMGAAMARSSRGEPYWIQVFGRPR
ncbi:MAG: CAP domain-containing protein [Gemmatimonadaceae bacterium]